MLNFPKRLFFGLLFASSLLFITSCDEDNLQQDTLMDLTTEATLADELEGALLTPPDEPTEATPPEARTRCFRFLYPIEFIYRNGETEEVNTQEDLRAFIMNLRETNRRANFVYPFEVELANEDVISINNFREFRRLRTFCFNRDYFADEPCFRYNFPLDVTINDRTLTINSVWRWRLALRAAARGATVRIDYPITVTLAGEEDPTTINNRMELNELRRSCGTGNDVRMPCFRFVYPLDLAVGEDVITVDTPAEWRDAIVSSGAGVQVRPVYPVDITISETAETVTVTEAGGWGGVRELCN